MQTNCCRKCTKLLCKNRNKVEDCKDCVSYVLQEMRNIDKKIKEN